MKNLHDLVIGPPLPTQRIAEERLGRVRALAALSPDALASIAYANQEIYLGLAAAGAAGLAYAWPIALAIAGLLGLVALSYTQVISAYPGGGGSYTVARENLGVNAGLIAAAALTTNYVLNVAVSVTAGVEAAASAFPALWPYRTTIALGLLAAITLANLRGLREAGAVMSGPVLAFIATYLILIAAGLIRAGVEGAAPRPVPPISAGLVAPALLLRTFAAGCTSLTGIESISNGVPVFKPPEIRHANQVMIAMAALMGILFLGTVGLTEALGVTAGPEETILSALARRVFGRGPGLEAAYLFVQGVTLLVLVVAANTSFVGFPRLASVVARDGYMPRQLTLLGDRLVFSNSILLLAGVAGALVAAFGGDTHALIPLFAVGAFLAFTLSQAGMVVHWWRAREGAWLPKAALNGVGLLATGAALLVIGYTKFLEGAWVVILLIPLLVVGFRRINGHYRATAAQLTLHNEARIPTVRPLDRPRVVLPISGVHRGVIAALRYARSISDHVTVVYVEIEPGRGEHVREEWKAWGLDEVASLVVVPSPYRSIIGPFLDFLDASDRAHNDGQLATVLLPEFIPARWWESLLHNQTAWLLKLALLYRRRRLGRTRAIIDVPYYLRK